MQITISHMLTKNSRVAHPRKFVLSSAPKTHRQACGPQFGRQAHCICSCPASILSLLYAPRSAHQTSILAGHTRSSPHASILYLRQSRLLPLPAFTSPHLTISQSFSSLKLTSYPPIHSFYPLAVLHTRSGYFIGCHHCLHPHATVAFIPPHTRSI